ncbi:hypothetical protein PQX77_011511 [Marasmius sp. AFHP31]|nr:hypothetical protein PQX77_011511 [Marasmius sp. AFHP31]
MAAQMHRRKSSQDDENLIVITEPTEGYTNPSSEMDSNSLPVPTLPRPRVHSTPAQPVISKSSSSPGPPPSAGPYQTGFNISAQPGHRTSSSAFRGSFSAANGLTINGHSRTRTVSTPYSPSQSSPLAFSFPQSVKQSLPPMSTSISAPEGNPDTAPKHNRRHSRMHSRNLSIFFPRPGSLPQSTINEDGSQELQIGGPDDEESAIPIPSADSNISVPGRRRPLSTHSPITPLGAGFTFGGKPPRPPGSANPIPPPMSAGGSSSSQSRRGHHHKHSLSHNFFSFLEPGANQTESVTPTEQLHTQPTPTPMSPWNPISPFPISPPPSRSNSTQPIGMSNGHAKHHEKPMVREVPQEVPGALAWSICQFALGGWMWVSGQQNGSLAVTGLGYWVVFHSMGVAVGHVLPRWLNSDGKKNLRRSYGDARIETVFIFSQAVYLMFSAVYICKETFEHVLLTAGSSENSGGGGHEGHHHHHADESGQFGIDFPFLLLFLSLVSIVISAFFYGTHSKLVELAGNRIPSIGRTIRSLSGTTPQHLHHEPPPTTPLGILLSNPYVTSPLAFCLAILFVSIMVPSSNHIACDLTLAAIITVITFNLAYSACVVLGTVLLQTAPKRGLSGGKMEAFLRVMREIERHPNVLHLPPPHIWQLTPTPPNPSRFETSSLVATLELHVRKDLSDDDVLALTKWAWERCTGALGVRGDHDEGGRADVTVGVVRG